MLSGFRGGARDRGVEVDEIWGEKEEIKKQ